MQVNSKKGLKAGRSLHSTFGSWSKVREASDVKNGVYVVKKDAVTAARSAAGGRTLQSGSKHSGSIKDRPSINPISGHPKAEKSPA